ncbi:ZZ-type zinc finger-containing protein 3-like [Sycon ciliatum]|uniref:ZZ-type zinc finger-containing protein 3-like n=1 Tax=Sycon ciliatum TaxID=27933 RepID=UPI0031F6B0A1
MSVQAPIADGFPQVFHPDMNMEGLTDTRSGGLLSDPDEPMMLSMPEFDHSGGYLSDYMTQQLPRIEVDDKSEPLLNLSDSKPLPVAGKSTPSKTGLRSRSRDVYPDASTESVAGRHMQKCTSCGEGIWQREAARRTSSTVLCPSCRVTQATKKRKNRSSSTRLSSSSAAACTVSSASTASTSTSDSVSSVAAATAVADTSCSQTNAGSRACSPDVLSMCLSESLESASQAPELAPLPLLKVKADDSSDPIHVRSASSWVPQSNLLHCRRKADEETLASLDCQRFYFESDQLALKGNPDHDVLLRTLVTLKAQRCQAVKDLDVLHQTRALALADPAAFVEELRNDPTQLEIPTAQPVLELPQIDWTHYDSVIATGKGTKARHNKKSSHGHHASSLGHHLASSASASAESAAACTAVQSSGGASMQTFTNVLHGPQAVAGYSATRPTLLDALEDAQSGQRAAAAHRSNRSSSSTDSKSKTFNQPWTAEEQARLEGLLETYPTEPIEARRWKKIAAALGNRTPRQVASRVQKYFLKLKKASLPVPGKAPSVPLRKGTSSRKTSVSSSSEGRRQQRMYADKSTASMSTIDSSAVFLDDGGNIENGMAVLDSTSSLLSHSDHQFMNGADGGRSSALDSDFSAEEMDMERTSGYASSTGGKTGKSKYMATATVSVAATTVVKEEEFNCDLDLDMQHAGYQCDGCGQAPLSGIRWHCEDCPEENSLDFCNDCVDRCNVDTATHLKEHNLKPIRPIPPTAFFGQDYSQFGQAPGVPCLNFLDAGACPAI